MKYRKVKPVLIFLLMMSAGNLFAQQERHMFLKPENPVEDAPLQITYNAEGTPLQNQNNVKGIAYCFINFAWKGYDVKMDSTTHNNWKGEFTIPDKCAFVAFKFVGGDSADNNKTSYYGTTIRDKNDTTKNLAGSYAGWGLLRSPGYNFDIPNYLGDDDGISDTLTYFWLQKELSIFHDGKETLAIPYATALYRVNGSQALPEMEKVINFLTAENATESDMLRAMFIMKNVLNNSKSADSLSLIIEKKYPGGNLEKLKDYQQLTDITDDDKRGKMAQAFLVKYPESKALYWFDEQYYIRYSNVYSAAIVPSARDKNFEIIKQYALTIPYESALTVYYRIIGIDHMRKEIPDSALYPASEALIKRILYFRINPPHDKQYLSPDEWMNEFDKAFTFSVVNYHINIAKNAGRYDEALQYAEMAEAALQYKSADVNNDYVFLLKQKGDDKKVNDVLIKSMYENQASPDMLDLLKQNYIKSQGSVKGFDDYLQSLKNAALSKNDNTAAQMINQPMVNWLMLDANNKKISLASLKGKTIIMDFWATWCVPCKASFPGMKLAVEKYKNDSNVVFFFVDTEEPGTGYKAQVNKYIKDNNYPFHVLFDNAGEESNDEVFKRICKAFSISGIPQKIVIDKNGNVRFITVGYKGSASQLADEISEMIDLTKNAN